MEVVSMVRGELTTVVLKEPPIIVTDEIIIIQEQLGVIWEKTFIIEA